MATGNVQMGNASLGNQSFNNVSGMQYNTRPNIVQGGFGMSGADGVGHLFTSRGEVIDNSHAMQNIGMNLKASGRTAGALTKASDKLESTSLAQITSAGDSVTAARSQFGSFEQNHGKGTRAGTTSSTGSTAQFLKSFESEQVIADKFAKEHGLKQDQMAQVQAFARAEASGGLSTPFGGATVSGGVQTTGTSSAGTSQNQKLAHELAQKKEFKEAVTSTNTAVQQKDFAQGEDAASKAARGIRASLDESSTYMDSASANHTKADSFRDAASRTTEDAAGFEANANNQFMNWMRGQVNPTTGKNFTASDVEEMAIHNDLGDYAQKFTDQVLVPEIENKIPTPTNNIDTLHEQNTKEVGDSGDVLTKHSENMEAVKGKQDNTGVTIGEGPKDTVSGKASRLLGAADRQINLGNSGINAEGQPLKNSVTANTDPTRQNNMGLAAQNAAASVLPEGTMKLLDAGGLVSADAGVAKPSADKFQGDLVDAAIDTAIFAGSMAIGGPLGGKVANKAFGKAGESFVTRAGKGAGDAAEATAETTAAATERRLAEKGMEKELAAMTSPEGRAAAEAAASRTAAKAEVAAQQTVEAGSKISGIVTGGAIANQLTGENGAFNQPVVQSVKDAIKQTDQAVLDIVKQETPPPSKKGE